MTDIFSEFQAVEDKRNILAEEQPFSYSKVKGEKALVFWRGKQVMILTGKNFDKLIRVEEEHDELQMQLFLAKITGHFKHGNER